MNLQDANLCINYRLHWNPLKLIQRIGRVDRLGSEHDNIYALNFLPETELERELGIIDKVEERVHEIGRVLGEDGEILSHEDDINESYMKDIYQKQDIKKVDEAVNEMVGSDDLIRPASNLQEIQQEHPELLDWLDRRDGIRSVMTWSREHDGVVIVYRQGEYTNAYLVTFPPESRAIWLEPIPLTLVDVVVEIMSRHNLEERYQEQVQWAEEQDEPPHVVAGMYLKGTP